MERLAVADSDVSAVSQTCHMTFLLQPFIQTGSSPEFAFFLSAEGLIAETRQFLIVLNPLQ